MTRHGRARALAALTCAGFMGTAGLHASGYASVRRVASGMPGMLGQIMPGLWLAFSVDLVVLGLIVGLLALRPAAVARPILAVAALCPLGAASLQLAFIGFIPPTGLLLGLAALAFAAAALWPRRDSEA